MTHALAFTELAPSPVSRTELTPLAFLERAVEAFGDRIGLVHGARRMTYREVGDHVTRLARAMQVSGIRPNDRVAYLCRNIPEMLMAHFAVPLAGAVLVTINTRLAPDEIAYILDHSGARLLVAEADLLAPLADVIESLATVEHVVVIDPAGVGVGGGDLRYAEFLARGASEPLPYAVDDENGVITINYTSGTTGRPKGVVFTHRGAYLNALGEIIHARHTADSVYLWTVPMFHCNGWCSAWAVTGVGGRHVCLDRVEPDVIWDLIDREGIDHLNAAPTVLISLANAPEAHRLERPLTIVTAGAPPSPTIIATMEALAATIVHVYGLTETYGPHTVNEPPAGLAGASPQDRATYLARQGVSFVIADPIRVVDDRMQDVPRDGATMGEVVMRGNNVMAGYHRDPGATAEAFTGGWFHSGDVGVWHPDGSIELRDRSKDIIVSGGENISTIEVEQVIATHPAVLETAVVATPDEKWGERPKAYVVLRPGARVTEREVIDHVRARLAHFKAPDAVAFVTDLPKTSTGKIQKFVLREKDWGGHSRRIH